jgi:hypothetical protein
VQTTASNTASFLLPFTPLGKMTQYEVCISHHNATSEKELQIKYDAELHCWEKRGDHFLFQLNRKALKINDKEDLNNPALELAHECGSIIYPIEFLVDADGRMTSVNNYPDILQRWAAMQPRLQAYFAGAIAQAYIEDTAAAIREEPLFRQLIRSDWFCTMYFAPLYRQYIFDFPLKLEISYPLLPDCQPVFFEVNQFRSNLDDKHIITICQEGSMQEQVIAAVFNAGPLKTISLTDAIMNVAYRVYVATNTIETIAASFKWTQDEHEQGITIHIRNKIS